MSARLQRDVHRRAAGRLARGKQGIHLRVRLPLPLVPRLTDDLAAG